jgi:hypothetical protein
VAATSAGSVSGSLADGPLPLIWPATVQRLTQETREATILVLARWLKLALPFLVLVLVVIAGVVMYFNTLCRANPNSCS